MSRVLIVISSFPSARARSGIDAALAAIAFDHEVRLLLIADGIHLLNTVAQGLAHGIPELCKNLSAVLHHGAEELLVAALDGQFPKSSPAFPPFRQLNRDALHRLLSEQDHVQHF